MTTKEPDGSTTLHGDVLIRRGLILGGVVLVLVLASSGLRTVDSHERAVVFHQDGSLSTLGPGKFQWVTPGLNKVTIYDVRSQVDNVDASAASRDLQDVNVKVAVQFHPDPTEVAWIHQNLGGDYLGKVIQPAVQEAVKSSTAQHDAANIIQNRPQVKDQIEAVLKIRLEASHIILDQVSLTNIAFSPQFSKAIEDSQTAKQNIVLEQNKLQVVRLQANQTIEQARAQAEAARLLSQAANSQEGSAYLFLEWLKKWDGTLPTTLVGEQGSGLIISPKAG